MSGTALRQAELLVGVSLMSDLGMGLAGGDIARATVIAGRLADLLALPAPVRSDVFYTTVLEHSGCTGYSHEVSALFRDELAVKRASLVTDFRRPVEIVTGYLPSIARSGTPREGVGGAIRAMRHANGMTAGYRRANCEVAAEVAARLGMSAGVRTALLQVYEAWDGSGGPHGLKGQDVALPSRIAQLATLAAVVDRLAGADAARSAVRRRRGRSIDPELAAVFDGNASTLLGDLAEVDLFEAALAVEPRPWRLLRDAELDTALAAFGDLVDLKTPYLHGHASRVSGLATTAAERLGLASDLSRVRRAALVHDLGRIAVPSSIWERRGALGRVDWEQVRSHPYHTERILRGTPALADLAELAGSHHERLDGSGYYRGQHGSSLPMASRVLAAADAYDALVHPRPHRPPFARDAAEREMIAAVHAGTLDADAVAAVLASAGHEVSRPRAGTASGLTERQVEVLRLVAAGLSNGLIGRRLGISARTAEHHVQDIYAKIGVSSRAGAAMFAMQHRLVEDDPQSGGHG